MTEVSVAGLPLLGEHGIAHPLAAIVYIKGLDEQGNVAYWSRATDGLSTVEAIGMATCLLDDLRGGRGTS